MANNVGKVFNMSSGTGGGGTLKLESISITSPPSKQTYKSGERFETEGMEVTASYGYGITAVVTGYTVSPQVLTDDVHEVTITYTEGRVTRTATTPVTVQKVLVSIEVTTEPSQMSYHYQEQFNPAGMEVTAKFSDKSEEPAVGYTYPKEPFTKLERQPVEIGYTYEEVTVKTTLMVTVLPIELTVPTQKDPPRYTGDSQTPEWNDYDDGKMTVSGDTEGTDADTYEVEFKASYGYTFPEGQSTASVTWQIKRAVIEAVPTQSNAPVADGSTKTPEWNGYDPDKMTIDGETEGAEPKTYNVTFTPTKNYEWEDGTQDAKDATWVITSVLVTVPTQKNIPIYDGTPKEPEWDNYDQDHSSVEVQQQTDAGEYEATFTLTEGMWATGGTDPKVVSWKIERATIEEIPKQINVPTYDNNPKTPQWDESYSEDKMTVEAAAQTNAGTNYQAIFTPTKNYKWSDGDTGPRTTTWAINKASYTIKVQPPTVTLNAQAKSAKFTVTREGNGDISAVSKQMEIATVGDINQNSGEVTVNSVADTTGTAEITVNVEESANYLAPSPVTVQVKAQFTTIYGVEWDWSSGKNSTKGTRTDAAAEFGDPQPAVNSGDGSSPFDNLMPWSGLQKEDRAGGVEVKEPKYWFKWTITDRKIKLQIADGPVDGFYVDPVNRDRGDGLGELDFSYIGRYHSVEGWKSETNKAQKVSITRSAARTGIRTLGDNFQQIDFAQFWYVGMLFLVEFADWNGECIGQGCSPSNTKDVNGKTDTMIYHTGTTAATRNAYGFTQYRNIEGWWDNVYDWMDGCRYANDGMYVITKPSEWDDSKNGVLVGKPVGGYPSMFAIPAQEGLEWALYPTEASGSTTTNVPDIWNFVGSNPCLFRGGYYSQGQVFGPFYVGCFSTTSTDGNVGCRLQERPPKAA